MLLLRHCQKNFQNPSLLGTPNSLQLSLPVVSDAASLAGSVCNFSRVSAPAVSSGWLLPSASGTSSQPLMGSAYLYQHSSTTMLSGVTGQSQSSTSAASYPVVETSLGRETFLGLQPPSQTFCLQQTPEFPKSCSSRNTQMLQSNPPHEPADISLTASLQTSNSNLLALSPAPKNWDEFNTNLSKPLDPDQIPIENQDPLPHPLEIPDILQLLACIDPLGPEDHPASENADLGKSSLSLEGQGTLENGTEASGGFADIATLMEDGHLPQLFDPLKDLDQPQGPELIQAKETGAIESIQLQEKSSRQKGCLR
uniref:Uncharacterized protein n=1 Tax=Equus asinus TaxID=9793 RepID=A0A9L0J456_EQUAS